MKKCIIVGLSLLAITSCGLFQPPPPPTPSTINNNLDLVSSGTTVNVVSLVPTDVPHSAQPVINNNVAFRVADDIRDTPSAKILIHKNSLIIGVYTNDGKKCSVSWQAIYPDYRSLELGHGTFELAEKVKNTACDPKLGIIPGKLFQIVFK